MYSYLLGISLVISLAWLAGQYTPLSTRSHSRVVDLRYRLSARFRTVNWHSLRLYRLITVAGFVVLHKWEPGIYMLWSTDLVRHAYHVSLQQAFIQEQLSDVLSKPSWKSSSYKIFLEGMQARNVLNSHRLETCIRAVTQVNSYENRIRNQK